MKDKLFLFTARYPAGSAEGFIGPELQLLSKEYTEVHIFPLIKDEMVLDRKLPANITVHPAYDMARVKMGFFLFRFFGIIASEFLNCPQKINFLRNLKKNMVNLYQCYHRAKKFSTDHNNQLKQADLYSFWMEDWATTLSFLKKQGMPNNFLCRVHGYDLYNNRRPEGFIPWRHFQLKYCSKIVAVSEAGKNYLCDNYPRHRNRFFVSRLGITGQGAFVFKPDPQVLKIVSCGNMVPLKRTALLARFLTEAKFHVQWTHFGDGPERRLVEEIVASAANPLLEVQLKGMVNQYEILDYYNTHHVDVFVHLSETEGGVPVALQEAACYGIVLLACDAGGVTEIVNDKTGKLLPVNIHSGTFFDALAELKKNACHNEVFRRSIREYWKNNFDLALSTRKFIGLLSGK